MWQRLERLYKAFRPDLAWPDDGWAKGYLKAEEVGLYQAMDVRDREHSVGVAKRLLKRYPDAPDFAIRAALLHDSGKALREYRPLERILTGLFKLEIPAAVLYPDWRGAFQIRQHHPEYAARQISDVQVAQIVREHHAPQSIWAKRLHQVDGEF